MAFENLQLQNLKITKIKNVNNFKASLPKKCNTKRMLFDKVDVIDTIKLVEEQYQIDRECFNKRYGVDLEDLENLPWQIIKCNKDDSVVGKIKCVNQKNYKRERAFKPYNYATNKNNTGVY